MPLLQITNLTKRFRTPAGASATIIDVPTFALEPAQQLALRGASGSGKTTFLHLIAGILAADAGNILIDGRDIAAARESERDRLRAAHVGYVFQTFNLLQGFTSLENVELAMMLGRGLDRAYAKQLLEQVGLADRLHHRPGQLSVGQQQRVALARAMANHPQLVLADEPTGSLDPARSAEALKLMRELCNANGAALLLVSHDESVLSQFEDRGDFNDINRAAANAEAAA